MLVRIRTRRGVQVQTHISMQKLPGHVLKDIVEKGFQLFAHILAWLLSVKESTLP